jgi:hypothetical protein
MSTDNSANTTSAASTPNALALQQSDAAALAERTRLAEQDAAADTQEAAELRARVAQEQADAAAKAAEEVAADDGLEEITLNNQITVRTFGGGTRQYGPGKVRVPRTIAEAARNAPTFATSGNPAVDRAVRRTLERSHGVQEVNTTDDTTARTIPGQDDGDTDRRATRAAGAAAGGGKERTPLGESELAALPADDVNARYDAAVKAGRVRPIREGKGSGADGGVVKADKVAALAKSGGEF